LSIIEISERADIDADLVDQLIADGYFTDKGQLIDLIKLLHGYIIVGDTYAGLIETLREEGFTINQFEFLFEADLIGIKISNLSDILPYRVNPFDTAAKQMMVLCLTEEGFNFAKNELGVEIRRFE